MSRDGWVLVVSAVLGVGSATVAFEVLHGGLLIWVLMAVPVFGLCAAIGFGLTGRWHPLAGALGTGVLFLLLFAPYGCSISSQANHPARWDCENSLGFALPGFSGQGQPSPSLTAPILLALGAVVFYVLVGRTVRRRRLVGQAS